MISIMLSFSIENKCPFKVLKTPGFLQSLSQNKKGGINPPFLHPPLKQTHLYPTSALTLPPLFQTSEIQTLTY